MNHMVFSTGGDWDSTTLYNNGMEVMAAQLFTEIHTGRDEWGNAAAGGIGLGGEITALVRPQDNPDNELPIFPGRLDLNFPGHTVSIENTHPAFAIEFTRVIFDGRDVTGNMLDLYVDINAVDNVVQAYIVLYKPHWIAADEVATYNLI